MTVVDDAPLVLVAEDSADVRLLLRLELEACGYRVIEASDGIAALERCAETLPDVVLLDLSMPRVDGYTVLREMKDDPSLSEIPVLVVSALDATANVVEGLRLGAHDYVPKPFQPAEVMARVDAAMRVKQTHDHLRSASRTDSLTGMPNRRALDEQLDHLLGLACRHAEPMAVAVIDVDRFKDINDRVGHAGGDAVLRAIAERVVGAVRNGDIAGRWGGDELVVLLPMTDIRSAVIAGERIRAAAAAEPIDVDGELLDVTVSVGCASGLDDARLLVGRADVALYDAKADGRNRVRPSL